MDISEVARKSGVAASALRYYERKGLIHSLESEGAGASSRRRCWISWRSSHWGRRRLLAGRDRVMFTPGGEPNIDRAMLAAKADELERMVKRLKAMIEGLRHAAACPRRATRRALHSSGCSRPRRPERWRPDRGDSCPAEDLDPGLRSCAAPGAWHRDAGFAGAVSRHSVRSWL